MEYSCLNFYARDMKRIADACVERALKGQSEGIYVLKISNMKKEFKMNSMDEDLLLDMLSERDELSVKDHYEGNATVEIMPEFIAQEGQTNLKTISPDELRIKLAKHYLWLHDEYGGVQADLSGYYIENFNFDHQDMCSVVMNGAKFVNCSFWETSLCSAECVESTFNSCNLMDITAEECNFYGAKFRYCRMERGVFTHSNFHKALLVQCDIHGTSFQNACIAESDWVDTDSNSACMQNTSSSFDDWESPDDVPGLNM